MTINERIGQLVKSAFGSQSNAARALGVDRQRINSIINGVKPGLEFVNLLCEKTEKLNLNWLIRGEGPMFLDFEELEQKEEENAKKLLETELSLPLVLKLWEGERSQWDQIKKDNADHLNEMKDEMIQLKEMVSNLSMKLESGVFLKRKNSQVEKNPKSNISKQMESCLLLNIKTDIQS
jgi:transcriptional regulator with XRE-family HTH domain